MKAWKIGLLTTLLFSVFIIVFHSSCERNVCDNITCFNAGSCNVGKCVCPIGYEGAQCETKSVARYLGVYSGLTTCDNGPYLLDSVVITADPIRLNYCYVSYRKLLPKVLHGYVTGNESTYAIIIPSDSSVNYLQQYTLTLQGDKNLSIHTYLHDMRVPGNNIVSQCSYVGTKQ